MCLLKWTTYKFLKIASTLYFSCAKERVKNILSFQMSPLGNNAESRAACCPRAVGWGAQNLSVYHDDFIVDRQRHAYCYVKARLSDHCCRGKAIITTYTEYVFVALVIEHATHMRCIILSSVVCLALPYFFFTLSHKRHDFRKKSYWIQNVCFDFLYKFCVKHFSF